MFVNKNVINAGAYIPKSKRCYNVKPSAYYFYMRTKIPLNFHICISVTLSKYKNIKVACMVKIKLFFNGLILL